MAESSRRIERERVLTLLYEAQMKSESVAELLASLAVAPEPFVVETVLGVDRNRRDLDAAIAGQAKNWSTDRMAAIDLNILRIAAWELSDRPELSVAVIISEAVELAKRFSTDESGKFVNGLLSSLADEVRSDKG